METVQFDRYKAAVVVPAYNEEGRVGQTLGSLCACWPNVVVVDDGSSDGTLVEAAQYPVRVLRHSVNLGQGAALQTGIEFALADGAEYIITFDSDGQHDPDDIPAMLKPLAAGQADYTLGSRFLGQAVDMPQSRRFVLKGAILFTRCVYGIRLTDVHNGLRAMTRRGAERIELTFNGMEHASQILERIHESGLIYAEVPVRVRYTAESLAKGQRSLSAIRIAGNLILDRLAG